jgi:hypothetical protein
VSAVALGSSSPRDLNDRGQLVGIYENTAATASPQPADTPPMSRMF